MAVLNVATLWLPFGSLAQSRVTLGMQSFVLLEMHSAIAQGIQ